VALRLLEADVLGCARPCGATREHPRRVRPCGHLGGDRSGEATWNLYERAAEPALVRSHAAGVRVYVKEALANGRLAGRAPAPELEAAAARAGTSPDAVALAAVLARPWADVVLSGAATVGALSSNLRAIEVAWSRDLDRRLAPMEEDSGAYWARRAELAWN
jgi:aryl-alcohol dehydrogenase-like predicted oxidoreductase